MTVAETVLVFAGVPLAVILVLVVLTLGPGVRNRRPRYKPGQPWNHAPVWYEPHPDGSEHGDDDGETTAIGSSFYGERHGADAEATHAVSGDLSGGGATAPRPNPAAPLGGARGTW